jgi:hypothetical protein
LFSKLINPKEISFSEVKEIFWRDNKKGDKNSRWPFLLVNNANKTLGKWVLTEIPLELFWEIKLPYHKDKDLELVPGGRSTVKKVYKRLKRMELNYSERNKRCYESIKYFSKNKIGTAILSSTSTKGRDNYSLNDVRKHLVHMDGLHRLMGVAYSLERKKYKPIQCIIAVKNGKSKN